ncbi:MAG: hypothetical protein UZ04_CHB001001685 [Chlorobi bacterium OLB4]|nr:MAG: hypothetical protein UZ04_CHB001001685 [Chlorobi bacterium OLB4]
MRVVFIPKGFKSFVRYKIVVSPSTFALSANITSETLFTSIRAKRSISSLTLISSGPTPSRGEILPCRTWYNPLYSLVLSIAITSCGSSTTQIFEVSRFFRITDSAYILFCNVTTNSAKLYSVFNVQQGFRKSCYTFTRLLNNMYSEPLCGFPTN